MLLLLSSFSITLFLYFLIQSIIQIDALSNQLHASIAPSVRKSDCRLEAINIVCNRWTWAPVFIRVYLIGIFETVYIALCKRGLFKHSLSQHLNEQQVDTLMQSYENTTPQTAVITGGDSGIGLEICKGLLGSGFHVIMGTRSLELGQRAVDSLKKQTGSDKVSCIELDLTLFRSVKKFAAEIKKKIPQYQLQLLINNAGVMNIPCELTKDGYETQCQTNFLSPTLLTQLLLPWMDTKSGRVLFASSSTLYAINDLDTTFSSYTYGWNGLEHYAYSKACIAHIAARLARSTRVKIYAYHPGTVRTKLFAHTTVFNLPFVSKMFDFIMLTPKEGSLTPLQLCLREDLGDSGTYWANGRLQTVPDVLINGKKDNIDALWKDTLSKCGI
ncbi:uncharacterized protein ATC70_002158 [Mucor velutinosus]|uniref:Uncharacterized protein n=1 Tax=Mucor velutinosus TaxID=708070 RepID=A0AAN7DHD3_9FUNG|nr:hypothetical protein ATC70_002158 [Mucor velutinosus]